MAIFFCVVALAAIAAGCGSDSDAEGTAAGGDGDGGTVTKAAFVKEGTALCTKHRTKIVDELTDFEKETEKLGEKGGDKEALDRALLAVRTILVPGMKAEVEELGQLEPPADDAAKFAAIVKTFEAGVEEGEKDPESVLFLGGGWETNSKAVKMAEAYGFELCGGF
jgi:hypothetical protein